LWLQFAAGAVEGLFGQFAGDEGEGVVDRVGLVGSGDMLSNFAADGQT
jgi:hypothetical protein